ncbi:MAG: hypothetical protein RLZZ381_2482 [Cyanobacteriota bacterium]|jgi:hypothetical protein
MNKQKQKRTVVRVRQPSFLESIARLADIGNVLGNDYIFFNKDLHNAIISFPKDRDFTKDNRGQISADWIKVCGDLNNTTARMERKYHSRLRSQSRKNISCSQS